MFLLPGNCGLWRGNCSGGCAGSCSPYCLIGSEDHRASVLAKRFAHLIKRAEWKIGKKKKGHETVMEWRIM